MLGQKDTPYDGYQKNIMGLQCFSMLQPIGCMKQHVYDDRLCIILLLTCRYMCIYIYNMFNIVYIYIIIYTYCHTVDGYNPAPPDMYKTQQILGQTPNLNWLAGFLPSTVCDYKTVNR